jgi:hypothetical protein
VCMTAWFAFSSGLCTHTHSKKTATIMLNSVLFLLLLQLIVVLRCFSRNDSNIVPSKEVNVRNSSPTTFARNQYACASTKAPHDVVAGTACFQESMSLLAP